MPEYHTTQSYANKLDEQDPLARYRDLFFIPKSEKGKDCIYFSGNSLGLQPKNAKEYVEQELDDWAKLAVEAHFEAKHPWLPYHEFLAEQMAQLVGASPFEVVVMNSLTVNLHLMLVSFYQPTATRHKIVMEDRAFPSDQYAVKSQIKFRGFDPKTSLIELKPRPGESTLRTEDIETFIEKEGDTVALILLGGINYYTGQAFEMHRITQAGHKRGCLVGFDLAHAAGNLRLNLHDWDVDFAVWCSYKYLNAGPGAVAGCFVNERFANRSDIPRLAGWWGQNKETRFQMGPDFEPIPGAEGWQISNPAILPMATLRASMDIFSEIGMEKLRAKSERLTGYLEFLLNQQQNDRVHIITPEHPGQRGCQLSIRVQEEGMALYEKLRANGVACDWRQPDVIRVAPVPLYNEFMDVYRFAEIFQREYHSIFD
ncbi:kynureninase [candidate division KSB1 bacterium]|nr:kynureninase [candidate division KSB1 bacterium]NIR68567.1 kynureninase [candidate division KSB1 bacterium]NIS25409.1 kynureninase [candidate division KSB1 bacterium]NIT72301.1 kynureninase [candidate division KSB1 bacterium]NIU26085.1 kynureninase [candidate division KSB1 bacterium]